MSEKEHLETQIAIMWDIANEYQAKINFYTSRLKHRRKVIQQLQERRRFVINNEL